MEMPMRLVTFLIVSILASGFFGSVKAQGSQATMQSFYDSTAFGIRIQANATVEASPGDDITVSLTLTGEAEAQVYVKNFSLSVFGFFNGTDKILMAETSAADFSLNNVSKTFNLTGFPVPDWVTGKTYVEITLAHNVTIVSNELMTTTINNNGFVCDFPVTDIKNVYLDKLLQDYEQLSLNYTALDNKLNDTLQKLNDTLQAKASDLDNTRTVAAVLGVTTVVFVATTMYLILRRPKQYW
jgi:hypothetical protein